jgi:hypothetical protein
MIQIVEKEKIIWLPRPLPLPSSKQTTSAEIIKMKMTTDTPPYITTPDSVETIGMALQNKDCPGGRLRLVARQKYSIEHPGLCFLPYRFNKLHAAAEGHSSAPANPSEQPFSSFRFPETKSAHLKFFHLSDHNH